MPFFSVLIPSYNRPEYLPRTVASVLASTFTDFELIVSDDRSPRGAEIESALGNFAGDPRLVFVAQPENLGEARNRHFLMQRAAGEYRIILGDDDLLAVRALATLHAVIQRQPGFDFYLFGYALIDGEGHVFETRRALSPLEISQRDLAATKDLFYSDLHPFWLYHPATFCFPASLHRDIQPNHRIGIGDDLIFLFDAILAGKRALVIPEALFSYRKFLRSGSYGQANLSQGRLANVRTRGLIFRALLARGDLPPEISTFIRSRKFRDRFLYNAIVIDPDVSREMLPELLPEAEYQRELIAYWSKWRRPWFRRYLQLVRVWHFMGYFGFSGLRESLRIGRQRRAYSRRSLSSFAR